MSGVVLAVASGSVRASRHRRTRRTITVCAALIVVIGMIFAVSMITGDVRLTLGQLWRALTGRGTTGTNFIVYQLRLPRVLTGLVTGGCFGVAGTIFQSLIKNPLASPDVIGISYGASAGGVVAILLFGWSGFAVSGSALVGALGVAALIYALAWRGGISGYRFVLVGIGVAAVLSAAIDYVLTRASVYDAQTALVWLTGSLNAASTDQLRTLAPAAGCLGLAAFAGRRWLRALQLGDDEARSLGVPTEAARLALIIVGVGLAAVATAAVGPVGFVAFVAGPLARRLTSGTDAELLPAALVGALVISAADLAGQHLFSQPLPVGVLTPLVGAPYLLWLLVHTRGNRSKGSS